MVKPISINTHYRPGIKRKEPRYPSSSVCLKLHRKGLCKILNGYLEFETENFIIFNFILKIYFNYTFCTI